MRICSLSYTARSAHARCCIVFFVASLILTYFSNYLIQGTGFGKKNGIEQKICVLIAAAKFVRLISHYKDN